LRKRHEVALGYYG